MGILPLPLVISLLLFLENKYCYEFMRTSSGKQYDDIYYDSYQPHDQFLRQPSEHPYLNMTFFPPLKNMQKNATLANEEQYPWIARIVHSKTNDAPYMCTAACIRRRIFLTAGRCIATLKVAYTTVIYRADRLPAIAFVLTSRPTKQMFDDVALVVVDRSYRSEWKTVPPYPANRSGADFEWFQKWDLSGGIALGFVVSGSNYTSKNYLYKMDVSVSNHLCHAISRLKAGPDDYMVPCYHSCTVDQYRANDILCYKYLAGEGHVIIDNITQSIIGIATWGTYSIHHHELPVGMAVPNSENFFEDYRCALKIRDDTLKTVYAGYYDKLCNG